ncbi:MAG: extracellular solute-binding protein family 1, partial [Firmicutes bacterium]|nr:extracellular solute-binding protein family 1 [Bacillota bacterium]
MPYDDYWTKLQTAIAGGSGPDLYWMTRPNYDIWSRLGAAGNIDDMISTHPELKQNLDAMQPFAVESYKYDGKFNGIPWGVDSTAIVYNEDALKAAGLKPLAEIEDQFTWDVLREYANKLTKREGDRITQYGFYVSPSRNWWDWVFSNGGEFFANGGKQFVLDSPQNIAALQFLADMQLKDKVSPAPQATQSEKPADMFMSGKIAIMQAGSWEMANFSKIKKFKWNVVQFPKSPTTGKRGSTSNVMGYIVNPHVKDKEAVAQLLTSLTSEPSQRKLAETGVAIPARKDAQAAFFAPNLPPANRTAFQKALEYAHPMQFSAWVSYQEFIKVTNDAMSSILTGAKPVDTALHQATAAINKSIQDAQSKK